MDIHSIIIYTFIIEVIVFLFFIILIPSHRLYASYKKHFDTQAKEKISQIIIDHLENKENDIHLLKTYRGSFNLLTTLEAFNNRIKDDSWEKIKNAITQLYLLSYARKKATKRSWMKRNFAARCFALTPLQEDRSLILKLSHDPIFLVRGVAAIAVVRSEQKSDVLAIIRKMSHEKGYAYYFYRDLLLLSSNKVHSWIKEIAENEKNPTVRQIYLELLEAKSSEYA